MLGKDERPVVTPCFHPTRPMSFLHVWNEVGASYKLTILPPWYRTYFAYITYVLILIFGFRSFGKYQAGKSLEKAENERRAGELQEAKELQNSLLPKVNPVINGFQISTYLKPATEIGGDYYDFFESNDKDNSIHVICGDATGHGTAAGMMVSNIKSALNGLPVLPVNEILERLNNIVKKINHGFFRETCFWTLVFFCKTSRQRLCEKTQVGIGIYVFFFESFWELCIC